jgi:elongation factor G
MDFAMPREDDNNSTTIRRLRNIGIMAHVDAGKTTCSERILFITGKIRKKGEVHHGTTSLDHLKIEIAKGITVQAAATAVNHTPERGSAFAEQEHRIQLIDTPGHIDFTIEVERSLRVLDGAVFILDAASGVECQSETVFRQAGDHGVPCLAFVNKIDKPGADFQACLHDIEERLGVRPVPVVIPAMTDEGELATIDVLTRELIVDRDGGKKRVRFPIPEKMHDVVEKVRREVVEICAEVDEDVMQAFCASDRPSGGRSPGARAAASHDDVDALALSRALRTLTLSRKALVVLAGSALKDCGIGSLLDAVVSYLPSPLERPPVRGTDPKSGEALQRPPNPEAPLAALAFKSTFDRNAGLVQWLRIYSGTLRTGDSVLIAGTNQRARIGRLYLPDGAQTHPIEQASAGSVVCVHGLGQIKTGETISDPRAPITLESIRVPDAVVSIVVEPKTAPDRDKLSASLGRVLACDPSLRSAVDPETGQTVLSGMGRLHLEIVVATLADDYGVELNTGRPRVAYKTTIGQPATSTYRHKKQSGGSGQFAVVTLEVTPGERGSGIVFSDETKGGVVPKEFVPAVEHGVRMAAERGIGSTRKASTPPVVDVAVRLLDGEVHVKDSSAIAFEIAAAAAFEEACAKAGIVLLEPVAIVEITAPEPHAGDVIGDLGSRRGIVREVTPRGKDLVVVTGRAPLAQTFDYVPRLRAITHGRGEARVTPDGYEVVPDALVAALLAE